MSLCDTCHSPGACCKSLYLTGGNSRDGYFDGLNMSRDEAEDLAQRYALPFVPLHTEMRHEADGAPKGWAWRWSCPELTPEGRCSIYANRPDLCRRYQAMDDDLCVYGPRRVDAAWRGLTLPARLTPHSKAYWPPAPVRYDVPPAICAAMYQAGYAPLNWINALVDLALAEGEAEGWF